MQLVIKSQILVIAVINDALIGRHDVQFEAALLQRLLDPIAQFGRSERRLQLALGLGEAAGAPLHRSVHGKVVVDVVFDRRPPLAVLRDQPDETFENAPLAQPRRQVVVGQFSCSSPKSLQFIKIQLKIDNSIASRFDTFTGVDNFNIRPSAGPDNTVFWRFGWQATGLGRRAHHGRPVEPER